MMECDERDCEVAYVARFMVDIQGVPYWPVSSHLAQHIREIHREKLASAKRAIEILMEKFL